MGTPGCGVRAVKPEAVQSGGRQSKPRCSGRRVLRGRVLRDAENLALACNSTHSACFEQESCGHWRPVAAGCACDPVRPCLQHLEHSQAPSTRVDPTACLTARPANLQPPRCVRRPQPSTHGGRWSRRRHCGSRSGRSSTGLRRTGS